jgi:adenylate cyclase
LEQQSATAEVLRIISSSPGELEPVFKAMLENATRICEAKSGNIYRWDGEALRLVATHNTPRGYAEARQRMPFRPNDNTAAGRMIATKTFIHVADITAERSYKMRDPKAVAAAEIAGVRTFLAVPMLSENDLIGAFTVWRQEVRPFTDKQIAVVQNFAAQAVIAIENTRLLNELRRRTAELTESLEQQTGASEVLRIVSSLPGELDPVFKTILENATRICNARFSNLLLAEASGMRIVAMHNAPIEFAELRRSNPFIDLSQSFAGPLITTKQVIHFEDLASVEAHAGSALATVAGARTALAAPMLREDDLVGAITIYRQEVRPFTNRQIALVQNFAAQAVIAIENARLLKELRERTSELERSYGTVRQQASQLEVQSQELKQLNQQLEQRVTEQVGEIERMGRLRRFLPPQVADLIVASGSEKQLESHRREITALFCDLRGFTGFSESSDPEDVMALLRDYHAAIGEIIIKFRGTLERYAGDGVMVIFNDPVPVDNPALQAVRMALEMRNAIGTLTERWRRLGHDIGFGIGIAHGFATLGTIGFEGRFDYAAIGTVSNVASRLCDEATSGQILISPRVLIAVEDDITVEPAGEFALKGIRRPLTAFNVVTAKSAN